MTISPTEQNAWVNSQDINLKNESSQNITSQTSEVVLNVQGVSKKFCRDLKRSLVYGVADVVSELVGLRGDQVEQLRAKEFWALKNVSFQLRRGEALGLIGKNGSGKSTLLRIIAGLIKPDAGLVEVNGRVAPLIALGAGFNPVLTGRENIYANMSILGLSRKEIDDRFDEVVDFAEIGEAIDAPVSSYSSGMAARLGFATAIHTQPDILLVDEVLAVGDIRFRVKCYRKLTQLRREGVTFILVSHDPHPILGICNSAIYISQGNLITSGEPHLVMAKYEEDLFAKETNKTLGTLVLPEKSESESLGVDILSLSFKNSEGKTIESIKTGEQSSLCIRCKVRKPIDHLIVDLSIKEKFGEGDLTLRANNSFDGEVLSLSPGEQEILFRMPQCGLRPGLYTLKMSISQGVNYNILDAVETFNFKVNSDKNMYQCMFYQPRSWEVVGADALSAESMQA